METPVATRMRGQHAPPLWGRRCRASRASGASAGVWVARERGGEYDATPPADETPVEPPPAMPPGASYVAGQEDAWGLEPSPAEAAMAQLQAAVAALAAVDWSRESADSVRRASVVMQKLVNRVNAQALRPVEQLEARSAYRYDGAVTAASWLRNRTNMDPATASRLCTTARRLRGLPLLAEAFAAGDTSYLHVAAIADAAVPLRHDAIRQMEPTLVRLAKSAGPRKVRIALKAIADVVDRDGVDDLDDDVDLDPVPSPADENDARRYWNHRQGFDGRVQGEYDIDGVFGEMLSMLMDGYSKADPADTPVSKRRSPGQKRADAMRAAVKALLDAGLAPTVQGVKPHLLGMFDLLAVMNRDQAAVVSAELHRTGRVSPATIARLALDAKITPVLTMGPWRVVAVGRTYRTLPPFLRPMMQMLHRRCRGPDCDRPACWAEAHHEDPFALGGDTDLNKTIPLCSAHHDLVTTGGWTVTMNRDTGICTWTAPDGRVITTYP